MPAELAAKFKAATEIKPGNNSGLVRAMAHAHVPICALGRLVTRVCAMTSAVVARLICQMLLATMSPWTMKGCFMEIINLGKADGLPPVEDRKSVV